MSLRSHRSPRSSAPVAAVLVLRGRNRRPQATRSSSFNSVAAKTRIASSVLSRRRSAREWRGARIDVRTVETGPPTVIPVSMRILGDEARVLRQEAEKLQTILKTSPFALNVRDDWGNDAIRTRLEIDQDRAGLAGVSSHDIACVDVLGSRRRADRIPARGRKNIPIVQLMEYAVSAKR